jgi:transcriptional regulator with XRE-family HTH domain
MIGINAKAIRKIFMSVTIRLGARLRAARKAAGFNTSKAFLRKYKIPASTYSQHESGARLPDDEMLKFYSKVFNINFNWLKTGDGQPHSRTSMIRKDIFSEELLDLRKPEVAHIIHEKLLENILEELLQKSGTIPIKKIVKMTVQIYIKAISKN